MNQRISVVILLILPVLSPVLAQTEDFSLLRGRVLNVSGEPIPYVNIGITEKSVGTVSDAYGRFTLEITSTMKSDTLRFSHVGYLEKWLMVDEVMKKAEIHLEEQPVSLKTVVVTGKRFRSRIKGSKTRTSLFVSGFGAEDLGGEVGSKINVRHRPSFVEEIGFFIVHNTFDTLFLRVNFYSVRRGLPADKIQSHEIISTVTGRKTGVVTVNIAEMPVIVQGDFIITLELVGCVPAEKGSVYFSQAPPYLKSMYYRETSFDKVKRYRGGPMGIYLLIKSEK